MGTMQRICTAAAWNEWVVMGELQQRLGAPVRILGVEL